MPGKRRVESMTGAIGVLDAAARETRLAYAAAASDCAAAETLVAP